MWGLVGGAAVNLSGKLVGSAIAYALGLVPHLRKKESQVKKKTVTGKHTNMSTTTNMS